MGRTYLPTDLIGQPPGTKSSVEGLTVGPDGNIYVPTFGVNTNGPIVSGNAVLFVIAPNGKIVRQVTDWEPVDLRPPERCGLERGPGHGHFIGFHGPQTPDHPDPGEWRWQRGHAIGLHYRHQFPGWDHG
jgi:hypothetical protein